MDKVLDRQKVKMALRYIIATIGEFDVADSDDVESAPVVITEHRSVPLDSLCAKTHLCFNQDQLRELHYTLFEQLGWLAPPLDEMKEISVNSLMLVMVEDGRLSDELPVTSS